MSLKDLPDEVPAEIERAAYRERLKVFLFSRDAGNALTLDSLKARIHLRTIISAATEITRYADEVLAIIRNKYSPPLHCREGCSYCCSKPGVLATIPELVQILNHVESTFEPDAIADLYKRACRYVDQLAGRHFNDPVSESIPCPLLVDNCCSVYDIRPLTCRGYNSMSVDACKAAHENRDVFIPIFSLLKDVTDGTTVGAVQALKTLSFNDSLFDLGTALKIALTAGHEFSEAIIDGSIALLHAEDASMVSELWGQVSKTAGQIGIDINQSPDPTQ
jgi:Fe-S-cluster containining protein